VPSAVACRHCVCQLLGACTSVLAAFHVLPQHANPLCPPPSPTAPHWTIQQGECQAHCHGRLCHEGDGAQPKLHRRRDQGAPPAAACMKQYAAACLEPPSNPCRLTASSCASHLSTCACLCGRILIVKPFSQRLPRSFSNSGGLYHNAWSLAHTHAAPCTAVDSCAPC
jgi:hypothetical protein